MCWKILYMRFLNTISSKCKLSVGICVLISMIHNTALGQSSGFQAALIGGINAAQIDGDDFAGFNKLGLSAGAKVGYYIKPSISLSTELLFNQSGSRSSLSIGSPTELIAIHLNYLELPVLVSLHDWLIDDKYHKVRAEAGLSLAYLFDVTTTNSFFMNESDDFIKQSVNFVAGIGYHFTEHIAISARYTRSFNTLYENPRTLIRGLLGYFFTFRFEYHI